MTSRALSRLLLLGVVLVWGGTFVVVKSALADASPLVFNLLRMLLATAALAALNWRQLGTATAHQLRDGALAGLFLAAGYEFQTLGLTRTTAAKSAFLTGLVVVLVPGLAMLPVFGGKRPGWLAAGGAVVAFAGLLLLTTPSGAPPTAIGLGDLLTLACALAFSAHLLTLAHVSRATPAGVLASIQIASAAALMLLLLPAEPHHHLHWTPRLVAALAATSLLGTAAAFTIQSFAQQHLPATQTAVLLTLEPVFAALTSFFLLGERLSPRALTGAALILAAVALIEFLPRPIHTTEIPA